MSRVTATSPASTPVRRTRLDFFSRLGAGLVALVGIVLIGTFMTHSATWTRSEMHVLKTISTMHTVFGDALALWISFLFSPLIAAAILLAVTMLVLLVIRRWRTVLQFVVIVTGSWLGSEVIKILVHRPRPDLTLLSHPLLTESSYSFPSGHTAFIASLVLGLIVITRSSQWRAFAIAAGTFCVLLVAVSRVYLGVHYVTDVIASLVYAAVAVSVLRSLWNRYIAPLFR